MKNRRAYVSFSGGQDSVTCLAWAKKNFAEAEAVAFKYGQEHSIELLCAEIVADKLDVPLTIIQLPEVMGGALLDGTAIPHELREGVASTFAPARNLLFLTTLLGKGYPEGVIDYVLGVNQVDYSGYPDCRSEFVRSAESAMRLAVDDANVSVYTPLMYLNKAQIFKLADELGCLDIILEDSHTCYRGDRSVRYSWGYGCASCPACILRAEGWELYENSIQPK